MPHDFGPGYLPPGVGPPSAVVGPGLPVSPPPPEVEPVDPDPWIGITLPPVEEVMPPPPPPETVVITPIVIPPTIVPPPPDMTPPTIVPPEYEDPIPDPMPTPPEGTVPVVQPPPTIVSVGALKAIGTFMVYRGTKLVLSMAASEEGQMLIENASAMLVGAVMKRLAPGTSIRFHTGKSPGDPIPLGGRRKTGAVGYAQAWRMVPQEFSYWEK